MKQLTILFEEISKNVLKDSATGGSCYTCFMKVADYLEMIKDIYQDSNHFQREIINIKRNKVYTKLVKDLIKGVVIPTVSLYFDQVKNLSNRMVINNSEIRILDGLQRTNCLIIAAEEYSNTNKQFINDIKNPLSQNDFFSKLIRLEIWIDLTVNGILYKMVSLNAGQTPMRIEHQFEVIELPLYNELKNKGVKIYASVGDYNVIHADYSFPLSLIVEASIAYNLDTLFPKKQEMAISFLDKLDIYQEQHESIILKSEIFMDDLIWAIKEFHETQIKVYSKDHLLEFKSILSTQNAFFIPFMAAMGKTRTQYGNHLNERKKALIALLESHVEDPLDLKTYKAITDLFRSGIGNKIRRLVYYAFYEYFRKDEKKIDWNFAKDFI